MSTSTPMGVETISCPGCGRTILAATRTCQFCRADLSRFRRQIEAQLARDAPQREGLKWQLFNVVASLWLAEGLAWILLQSYWPIRGLGLRSVMVPTAFLPLSVGATTALVAIGMLGNNRLCRFMAHPVALAKIALGALFLRQLFERPLNLGLPSGKFLAAQGFVILLALIGMALTAKTFKEA